MADQTQYTDTLRRLRWPLFLTLLGMVAERLARAFWPLWSVGIAVLAMLMLGVQDIAPVELVWSVAVLAGVAALVFLARGLWRFRFPRRNQALARLDASLKGQPIQALRDAQAIGAGDAGSSALWAAHQARMAARAAVARRVRPDLRLSSRDPFGLRYIALMALMVALLFGSFWRVGSVGGMAPGSASAAAGPSWEGWVAPPAHTGLPTIYLSDITGDTLKAPEGALVTLRLYGPEGRLKVDESVSGRIGELPSPSASAQEFSMHQSGRLAIDGPGGHAWQVALTPDQPPSVTIDGPGEATVDGQISIPFSASDDYGVEGGEAVIALDLDAIDRRYGLAIAPEPRDVIRLPVPMPISGSRNAFKEALIENFSQHPWANLPVKVSLTVEDAMGQTGQSDDFRMLLDARSFFDPVAAALIEMRRDLLWNRQNAERTAQVLRAITWQPAGLLPSETMALRLKQLTRRLETLAQYGPLSDTQVGAVTQALWDMAVALEDGDIDDARARMERAQERLSEAMRNGASDQEIAKLMQELRDATQNYMRQMSQQAARDAEQNPDQPPMNMDNAMQMNQNDLQRMMDRIQELMEQGRMAEAQEALQELQKLMENMKMTQGQGGQGQQSPGQQAMEGLSETLRNQQGLSDEAFRQLQDQFNQNGQQGQQPGQPQGQQQGQGQGQQPGQQQGQGQQGQQFGQGQQQGQQPGGGDQGSPDAGTLAQRQEALRQELERQRGNLPGDGTAEGRAAREALNEAGRAMKGAEGALRDGDLAEAIDQQSQAMEALRDGMRQVGEALAQQERQLAGQQGEAEGNTGGQKNDPLGRNAGSNGNLGNDGEMLQGEDVYRRARDLLAEIRRRSGDNERSEVELDYLRRLLDRF